MDTKVKQLTTQQLIDQGVALQAAGAVDNAREIFQRVIEREPRNAAAHYSLGAIESGAGNYLQALKHIKQVLVGHPKFALAHLALSIVMFHLGELEKAQLAAESAVALEPELTLPQRRQADAAVAAWRARTTV